MFNLDKKTDLALGIIFTIVAYAFLATSSAFVRVLDSKIPPYEILLFQSLISLFFVIPYAMKHKTLNFERKNISSHLIRGIAGYGSYFFFFAALRYINLIDATVIMYTAPFFIPFIGRIWMKDPVEKDVWWAIILGFLGIVLILKPTNANWLSTGSIIAFISAIFTGSSLVSIRVLSQRLEPLSRTLLYFFIFCTLFSLPFSIIFWKCPTLFEWLILFCIGIATVLGQLIITFAFRFGSAAFLSPLCYFMVIFTMIISRFFFHQHLQWSAFLGIFLVILGGSLTFLLRTKTKKVKDLFYRPKLHWWNRKPPL